MPRQPRYNIAGGVYHVIQRGVEKRDIVCGDEDRHDWMRLLARNATRCDWQVFAFALLSNHFHIFLRTPRPNLSEGMQAFESGFVSLFNKRHERVGPLFQGRFGAVLVEQETHGRVLSRYVHMNPFHAGLAPQPAMYRWSSYRYYLDPRGTPSWLDWRTILAEVDVREAAARIKYRRFVEDGMQSPPVNPLDDVREGWLLGSDRFVNKYLSLAESESVTGETTQTISHDQLVRAVAETLSIAASTLLTRGRRNNAARDILIWLERESCGSSLQQMAEHYGVGASAICESLRRASRLLDQQTEWRDKVEHIRAKLGSGTSNFNRASSSSLTGQQTLD